MPEFESTGCAASGASSSPLGAAEILPSGRTRGLIALAVAGIGVCCGIPLLLSAGLLGALTGIGLRNWLLLAAGLVLVTLASVRCHQARRPVPSATTRRATK